ncbi:MAG: hypothetical protein ACRBFS_10375 [Aureispira sp.]
MGFKMPSFLSGSDAGIERLTITSHQLRDCTDGAQSTFKVQVNPQDLSYRFGYNGVGEKKGDQAAEMGGPGQSGTAQGFSAYNKMGMEFVFHADATGLLPIDKGMEPEFLNGKSPSIRLHLNKLQDTVYGYDEEIHGPRYLKLVWGKVFPNSGTKNGENNPAVYKAMLKECKVDISLFSLKGEPVKAKITLSLISQMAPEERPLGKSPDLTHYFDITEGDKMTSYCNYIYGRYDSKICSAIAEYNNMIDWKLKGGTKIIFPSIHMLEDKYLEDYEEVEVTSVTEESEEQQMRELIGEKRANQYYKVFPNKNIKSFEA